MRAMGGRMAEIVAALLLVLGAATMLIAAIGLVRFPDAFLRMHAATKAGVIGAGLCALGAACALGDAATWIKAALIVAFLIVTTPIASHALGRAAWQAGAPFAPATRVAPIPEELPRAIFDAFPEFGLVRRGDDRGSSQQEDTMIATETRASEAQAVRPVAQLDEVILGAAWHRHADIAASQAAAFAAACGARMTIVSLVDRPAIEAPQAVPLGGLAYATRLSRARLVEARLRAAETARVAGRYAEALGVKPAVRHVEGRPDPGHFACDRQRSLVVMGAGGWFDQGTRLSADEALAAQRALDVAPLLLTRGEHPLFDRLLILHDGGARSAAAIAAFATHPFVAGRTLAIAGVDGCGEHALAEAAGALSVARPPRFEIVGRYAGRAAVAGLAARLARSDVIVAERTLSEGHVLSFLGVDPWRAIWRSDKSMLLL